jgi:MoaA/NifB/PqqE/SkfB family radical SAM enzyme
MPLPLPNELYIEVTNRCNSLCETCVRTFMTREPLRDLTLEEFRTLVDQAPALERTVLHGVGEPLLNRDLVDMIAYLKGRANPPQVLFNSNAILLTPEVQQSLIDVGLDEYRISTDAAHRELYARIRGVDGFDQMTQNVQSFAQRIRQAGRGPRLSLWFTAIYSNLGDLPDLVRLAHRLGVSEVYVQRMVYYGEGLALQQQSVFRTMQDAEKALLEESEALANELAICFRASGATSPGKSLLSADGEGRPWSHCRRPTTLMYISANGNVLPCCLSPYTTRDYQGLILGNAFQAPLAEVWDGAAYRRFRDALRSDMPWESCDRCGLYWSL